MTWYSLEEMEIRDNKRIREESDEFYRNLWKTTMDEIRESDRIRDELAVKEFWSKVKKVVTFQWFKR